MTPQVPPKSVSVFMTALCYVRRSLACKKRVDALKCSTVHALKRYKVKKDKKYIQDYRKV